MKDKTIGVVMGGVSTEREVSLNTGKAILGALIEKGYKAVGIDLDPKNFIHQLQDNHIEIVFNAMHGKYGEDGILQGVLEMLGIPYTGSGVLASAIAMDKSISKQLFVSADIPTPRYQRFEKHQFQEAIIKDILASFTFPVVVKASTQGSSIGVYIVEDSGSLAGAVTQAFEYSDCIIVEEFIKGKEVTVAVLGGVSPKALPPIEIAPFSGKYDYHSKYTKGATNYIVPAKLNAAETQLIGEIALKTFRLLGCCGVARVDFMVNQKNQPYVLEVNTIPGMTATSLVPKAAAAAGIPFADLCEKLLLMAVE